MFEQKIVMKTGGRTTADAFGIPLKRKHEILRKLVAVASIYPKYSVIAEVFLNCEDRFTEMERLYGLFELGKVSGSASMMRMAKIQVKCDAITMPLEQKLLSLMSKHVVVENKFMNQFMKV